MGLCPDVERPPAARRGDATRGHACRGTGAQMLLVGRPRRAWDWEYFARRPMRLAVHAATAVFGYFPLQLERTRGRYQTFYSKRLQLFSKHGAGRQISPLLLLSRLR
jgi:hypothetical protein